MVLTSDLKPGSGKVTPCASTSHHSGLSKSLFSAVLVIAALIGAVMLSRDSLWIDEGGSAFKAIQPSIAEWWRAMRWEGNSNLQMPLYLVTLWGWEKFFGPTEIALRSLNVVFLLLTVIAFCYAFRSDRILCFLSVSFLLSSAFMWSYVNEARPYTLIVALSALMFAEGFSAWRRPEGSERARLLRLMLYVLLLCTAHILAVPWAVSGAILFLCCSRRNIISITRTYPLECSLFVLSLGIVGAYFAWTIGVGIKVTKLGSPGVFTTLSMLNYEFLGFSGLGPGRNLIREQGLKAFSKFWPACAIYGCAWIVFLSACLKAGLTPRLTTRTFATSCIFIVPLAAVVLAGHLQGVRLLPRHLAPVFPVLIGGIAVAARQLWSRNWRFRLIISTVVVLAVISATEIRFAPRHSRDDYKSACAFAREATLRGKRILWAADVQTAIYYKLLQASERESGTPKIALHDWIPSGGSDVIVLTRPDTYDPHWLVRHYVRDKHFELSTTFEGFEIWIHR